MGSPEGPAGGTWLLPHEPFIKAKTHYSAWKGAPKVPSRAGHQAEVAPAVEVPEGSGGDIEPKGPALAIGPATALLGDQTCSPLLRTCQPWAASVAARERLGPVLAEDVEIVAGPVEPDGDRAHQAILSHRRPSSSHRPALQQGMGGALALPRAR